MSTPLSFSSLKRSRGSFDKLTQALQNSQQSTKGEDTRFWEPTVDKAGNGHAVIRFLPASPKDGEDGIPWVRLFNHGFQASGGWFIDRCPTTIDQKCPVCEGNTVLWNSGIEANKTIVRDRKRKLSYVSNILVVSDPAKPDNDGKVFLFKYGKKIFDKVYEKMHPEFPDEKAFNPFDLWEGANFKLKIRKVEGYRNYDKSEFSTNSPVSEKDDELEAIWNKELSLKEFLDAKNFKTYTQLEARRVKVLGSAPSVSSADSTKIDPDDDQVDDVPVKESLKTQVPVVEEDDEDLNFFKNLAEQD